MTRNILEGAAGVPDSGPLAEAVRFRARLMDLTQASHDAALLPREPGGLNPALRATLAARIARLNGDADLASHYISLAGNADEAVFADPETAGNNPREAAILSYVDGVTKSPRDATRADIESLRTAGIDEGDIVRLAGLVAFVNYQIRVALVLRKLGGME